MDTYTLSQWGQLRLVRSDGDLWLCLCLARLLELEYPRPHSGHSWQVFLVLGSDSSRLASDWQSVLWLSMLCLLSKVSVVSGNSSFRLITRRSMGVSCGG